MQSWVILSISVLAVAVFLVFDAKNTKRKRAEVEHAAAERSKREMELQSRAQEARRQNDLRYDRLINCLGCQGTGTCRIHFNDQDADGVAFHWYTSPSRNSSEGCRIECVLCDGSGVAKAFVMLETCPVCKGKGRSRIRVKADVGVETTTVVCDMCSATGKTMVVNVKFSDEYWYGSFFFGEPFGNCELSDGDDELKIPLTPANEHFFEKYKPRALASDA